MNVEALSIFVTPALLLVLHSKHLCFTPAPLAGCAAFATALNAVKQRLTHTRLGVITSFVYTAFTTLGIEFNRTLSDALQLGRVYCTHSTARFHTIRPLVLPRWQQPSPRFEADDTEPPDAFFAVFFLT